MCGNNINRWRAVVSALVITVWIVALSPAPVEAFTWIVCNPNGEPLIPPRGEECEPRSYFPAGLSPVEQIQYALDQSDHNGESDIIIVLPGVYQINSTLHYQAAPSDTNRSLLIAGLGTVFKPTFQRGEHADDSNLLSLNATRGAVPSHPSNLAVADIIFEGARSRGSSGGLFMTFGGPASDVFFIKLINNYFRDNETAGSGGGAHLESDNGHIDIFNNIFEGNRVSVGGRGGGLYISSRPARGSSNYPNRALIQLFNNTFLNNEAALGGGLYIQRENSVQVTAYANLFWSNTGSPQDFYSLLKRFSRGPSPIDLAYSQIEDFLFEREEFPRDEVDFNVLEISDLNPLLDGFTPRTGSPVIDSGPPLNGPFVLAGAYEPPVYDYLGRSRVVDGDGDGSAVVDRGAIEVDAPGPAPKPEPFLPIKIIPDVPEAFGRLPSAPVRFVSIGEVATNSDKRVGWTISPDRTTSGIFAVYYGDPVARNYDTGKKANQGAIELPAMTFKKGERPLLAFMLFMDTQQDRKLDTLRVYGNKDLLWEKSPRTIRMGVWQPVQIDLAAYGGKTVKLAIKFDTINGSANRTEGVYIDDIVISRDGRLPAKYSGPRVTK